MHIDTAREYVRSDQDFGLAVSESINDDIALLAFEISSQAGTSMAVVFHPSLNFTSSVARLSSVSWGGRNRLGDDYLDKDDGRTNGHKAVKADQDVVFFPWTALEIELFDPFHGELFVSQGDLVCIWCKILRVLNHVIRKCG